MKIFEAVKKLPGYLTRRLFIAALLLSSPSIGASEQTYNFGVVPQQSSTKLARTWVPLLQLLQQKSGVKLAFATAPDIPTFEKRLRNGEYDFAYMNPYHYTVFHQLQGYQAFAKQANKQIRGILVVRNDSPVKSAAELKGKEIAFPAPAAFAATLLTRSYLEAQGVAYDPRFVSSHDSVYRAVAGGFVSAGGGIIRTLESVAPEIRSQLRVLWESAGYTPHAFAAHPRIPRNVTERLLRSMLELNGHPEGLEALERVNFQALEKATDGDWDDVRALSIGFLQPEK